MSKQYLPWLENYLNKQVATCFILGLTVTLINVSCTQTPENLPTKQQNKAQQSSSPKPTVDSASNPEDKLATIKVAIIPGSVSGERQKKLQPLADYLAKTLKRPVKFQVTKNYEDSVKLLVEGKVELAFLGAFTYIKARLSNPQIEPIVAPIDKISRRPWYTSVIVANSASGIKTLKDLKGKRFAFVSKSSTSGYLMPMVEFKDIGINPERDFALVKYIGSHDKAQAELISGDVDAIADDKRSYLAQQKAGKLAPSEYKIIWESDPIPNLPIVVSSNLSSQLKADLKKAFINAPEGFTDLSSSEGAGYTLVQDEDYEPIRQKLKRLGLKLDRMK